MNEEWRDVKGYEGLYRVSNLGRVYSLRTHKCMAVFYRQYKWGESPLVKVSKNGTKKYISLPFTVMEAFRPEEAATKKVVRHKDGDVRNNRLDNLEFLKKDPEIIPPRYNYRPVYCVELDKTFISAGEAGKAVGVKRCIIAHCCHKRPHYHTAGGYHWRFADEG